MARIFILAAGVAALGATAGGATPVSYGAASFVSVRNCLYNSYSECGTENQTSEFYYYFTQNTNTHYPYSGTAGYSVVRTEYSDQVDLPILKSAVYAAVPEPGVETRVFSRTMQFQSYTYNGSEYIDFALQGSADFTITGSDGNFDEDPGESEFGAIVTIFDPSVLHLEDDPESILNIPLFCGQSGVIATEQHRTSAPGRGNFNFNLATDCENDGIELAPGQELGVAVFVQQPAFSGAYVYNFDTFTTQLSQELGTETIANLERQLSSGLSQSTAVPAPGSLGILLLGLAGAGLLRTRRAR